MDLQLEERKPPEILFHGAVERFLSPIMVEGLKKGKRHHVHLSQDMDAAQKVGARRGKPIVLQVDTGDAPRRLQVLLVHQRRLADRRRACGFPGEDVNAPPLSRQRLH